MIDTEHVCEAFARFADFLNVGEGEVEAGVSPTEVVHRLYAAYGFTEEVQEHLYEHAAHIMGEPPEGYPLLMGFLWGLMAADAAGTPSAPTLTEDDWQRLQNFANGGQA